MECALCKIQYVGKAETTFIIRLDNHRKDINNPKSIPADLHFRKPGHSFNLHPKLTLIEQLSNIHTRDKDTLKLRSKCREDFWIQKLETITPKRLNQELIMFKFLSTAFLVCYSPFSIAVWERNASVKSRDQEKLTSNFDHFVNLLTFTKFP